MIQNPEHLQQPVMTVARRDVATLRQDLSVQEALEAIRGRELGEKIVYFYVVDAEDRLAGCCRRDGCSRRGWTSAYETSWCHE